MMKITRVVPRRYLARDDQDDVPDHPVARSVLSI
jgi:hypothetical protein